LDFLFPSLAFLFHRQQQAKKKKKKLEMQKKQKKQKKRKKKQKRETQEEKYGKNCRRSSSSADYNASVWYKNWGTTRVCERRGTKNRKWRNIKNTNKYATYTTRTKTNVDDRRDLWNAHIYRAMATRAESRIATTITTTDNDDDETAVVDIAR